MKHCLMIAIAWATMFFGCRSSNFGGINEKPYLVKLKINESDCLRCMNGLSFIEELSEVADVELVFNGLKDKDIERFIQANGLENTLKEGNCFVVSDKNVYNNLWSISLSEGHVFDKKGNELLAFSFRVDDKMRKRIRSIIENGRAIMQNCCPIRLKTEYGFSSGNLYVKDGYCLLFNGNLNLCQVFDEKGILIREIDGGEIDPLAVFPEMKTIGEKNLDNLKHNGLLICRMQKVSLVGDEIWVKFETPYAELSDQGSIILIPFSCIISFPMRADSTEPKVIFRWDDKTSLFEYDISSDGIDGSFDGAIQIFMDDRSFQLEKVVFLKRHMQLEINRRSSLCYPVFNKEKYIAYLMYIKDGLFNLRGTDFLYYLENDTVINMPVKHNLKVVGDKLESSTIKQDIVVRDWAFDGANLGMVYRDLTNGNDYYSLLSEESNEFVTTQIKMTDEMGPIYMTNPFLIYYVENNDGLILRRIMPHFNIKSNRM